MSSPVTMDLLTEAASQELGARAGEGSALAALRAEAYRESTARPLPTPAERPWKYFDPATVDFGAYTPGATYDTQVEAPASDGLTAVRFADASGEAKAALDQKLGSAVTYGRSKLTALHYAFGDDGVLVQTAANAEVKGHVRIRRSVAGGRRLAAPHTLIVTGANSVVSIIEEFHSPDGDDLLVLPAVEVLPGPGSQVRYTVLHRWGAKTRVFSDQCTVTERDSALYGLVIVTGGAVVKSHIESSLVGRGSASELLGLSIGRNAEQADFYTLQDHVAADTRSDLLFKSALKERSRAVYYGVTRVGLGAKNADANQEDRNLLLSREARADSDPVLEILTHDIIRASHGATAGPVDEEQLYYLETRGIPRAVAEAMLVKGFIGQVSQRIPDEALRDELDALLDARLEA